MIDNGSYEPVSPRNCTCGNCNNPIEAGNWCPSPPELDSKVEKSEVEKMIQRCYRDIRRGFEEGRLELETPRGHVGQDALLGTKIEFKYAEEKMYRVGQKQPVRGPPLIGMEFGLSIEHEGITSDLSSFDTDVVVYGDQHMWLLTDPWEAEVGLNGMAIGDEPVYDHEHWWGTVELNGWND